MTYIPYDLEDVRAASAKKLFTVVSTFAGGGGSSTGYRLAGGNVLAINEFVEEAIKTYSQNFPETKIIPGDIKTLTGEDFLTAINLKPGELDILDGSPPCSAFSMSDPKGMKNKWKGATKDTRVSYFDDSGSLIQEGQVSKQKGIKSYSDNKIVEAIEDLFHEYIRIATVLKPKVIIAENVKGITLEANRSKLQEFLTGFERIDPGYIVTYKVLNATKYGVPQSRKRTFFVCVRSDIADVVGINFLNCDSIVFPREITSGGVSIESAIGDIDNDPAEVKMLTEYCAKSFQLKFLEKLPFNPPKVIKPGDNGEQRKTCFNLKRPSPKMPCPTLTQTGQQLAPSGVVHYAENRKLTIKEMKRIMSLPDDFELTGTFDQKAERIGRMVAPKMMAALASNVYEQVLRPYKGLHNGE